MTKIDIISGFLGAGKTTLIKKLLTDAFTGEQVVLIENEFGEIGIDGGFLKDSGIEIREMNSGCICCSLVGDFGTSLREVVETYHPDRILIEPSGVGKLSDVIKAVQNVQEDIDAKVNSFSTVVDVTKCRIYRKNFGEFFSNQIEYAGAIILSRTDKAKPEKVEESVALLRELNEKAPIITTPIAQLPGKKILETMEDSSMSLEEEMMAEAAAKADKDAAEHAHHHHHHDHDHGDHDHDHDHEHDHDHDHEHDHDHDHEHDDHEHEHGDHDHDHDHDHGHDHDEHDHDHDHEHEHGDHEHDHEHGHEHDEHDEHDHDHDHEHHHHHHDHEGHHHADDIFDSWGKETIRAYTEAEIESILTALDEEGAYGTILRAKGMVAAQDGEWIYFDMVPGEHEIRRGAPEYTGRLCVIGAELKEDKLKELFLV